MDTHPRCWKQKEGSAGHTCSQGQRGRGTGELISPDFKRHMIQSQGFTLLTHAYVFYLIIGFSCTYCYQFVSWCYFSRQPQWETLVCRAVFAFLQVFMDIHIANTHINRMPFIFKQCFWSRMASQLREWKRSDLYHLSQRRLLPSHILTSAVSAIRKLYSYRRRHEVFNNPSFLPQKPNKLALPIDLYSPSPLHFFQTTVLPFYFSSFLHFHLHIFKALKKNSPALKGYYRNICYLSNNRPCFLLGGKKKPQQNILVPNKI